MYDQTNTTARRTTTGWCRRGGLVVALLVCTGAARGDLLSSDLKLTLAARTALADDDRLRELDLGISVKNNVARVWGSVPSADLAQRAVDRARRVPGIERVVDQLVVESPDDPLVQFLKTPKLSPVFGKAMMPNPETPTVPAPPPAGQITQTVPEWRKPAASVPPGALAAPPGNQWWSPARELTPMMPVLRLPTPGERSGQLASAGNRPAGLERDVERLKQAYPRLQALRVEVQDGSVRFHGPVADWPGLYDLARQAARLPGVTRVLLPGS